METGQKKRRGNPNLGKVAKERAAKAAAMDAMFAEYGVSSVEELREKLSKIDHVPTTMHGELRIDGRKVYSGGVDPLLFITDRCPYVALVSSTSSFVLRPSRRSVYPHITRIALKAHGSGPWAACPWYIGDRDDMIHDRNLKVWKEAWHQHRLTREMAEAVWSDERWPKPREVILAPEDFQGWDTYSKSARGNVTPVNPDEFVPLREITRHLLQKSRDTFLDWLTMPKDFKFDRRVPNPYRNKITDVSMEWKRSQR